MLKNESSSKLKQAVRHHTRTYSNTTYNTADIIFYNRKDNLSWRGSGTVIGRDGQQVLKHGSNFVRVHLCNFQLKNDNNSSISRFNRFTNLWI